MGKRLTSNDVTRWCSGIFDDGRLTWYVVGAGRVWHSNANDALCCETCKTDMCRHVPLVREAIRQRGRRLR